MRFKRKSKGVKAQLLSGVRLFSACSKVELRRLASIVDEVDVPQGRVLTTEGKPGVECFVIVEGRARASARGRKIATLEAGDFFGEMSLLDGGPRSATVTADSDMHLLVMTSRGFSQVVEDMPSVARKILRTLAERLRETEKRTASH
jgi:CRP/FNR family cyclic AMP-dependent transcriptional regulator